MKIIIPALISISLLSACGGGGSANGGSTSEPVIDTTWVPNQFHPSSVFENKCVSPRSTVNPLTGNTYLDKQGSVLDENNWLRSWNNNVYLWYDEVLDQDPGLFTSPIEYFSELKTFATTASGKAKDEFHFTVDTAEYLQQSQSGIISGYGMTLTLTSSAIPRELLVSYTQPNSPATSAAVNLKRGTKILEVDDIDLVNTNDSNEIALINAALSPENNGELHTFKVQDVGSNLSRLVTMTSSEITLSPVQNTRVIPTQSGNVGYMLFNEHIASAEEPLIEAITHLKADNIVDLVLDLRYNGGGYIYIASGLASMISDYNTTNGKVFEKPQYNDKHPVNNPFDGEEIYTFPFFTHSTTTEELPRLGLSRVFVLTGAGTCSASELIMNGLRGIGLEVIQIGNTTCGKPYGFRGTDNCGTTYFSVNFKAVNNNGFGDYADGFSPANSSQGGVILPGCAVADDFTHQLGDIFEARLSVALSYRNTGQCPSYAARPIGFAEENILKPLWLQNALIQ